MRIVHLCDYGGRCVDIELMKNTNFVRHDNGNCHFYDVNNKMIYASCGTYIVFEDKCPLCNKTE